MPYQKSRKQKVPVFLFGEGKQDYAVLTHLTALVGNCETSFYTVKHGYGGSPSELMNEVLRYPLSAYSRHLMIIDGDRDSSEYDALRCNSEINLLILPNCMEGLLLDILEPGKGWMTKTSKAAKSHFQKQYISGRNRSRSVCYSNVITGSLLNKAIKKNAHLLKIVSHITG
jgi:hypothetical protein